MTIQANIESLLEKKIGLLPEAIGVETITKAIEHRMKACGLFDPSAYLDYLQVCEKELEELIEMVVVPETWFFRNKESFAFLARYVRTQWVPENKDGELRILSIPCSTGEEPYSIAMTLMDTGLPGEIGKHRFYIEAIDISNEALQKARLGIYGRESFRGKHLSFRDRYFDQLSGTRENKQKDRWQIKSSIRSMVRFKKGNLVDKKSMSLMYDNPYHIIFCRNLMIYLSESGKKCALEVIENLLEKIGILFVGHVERPFVCGSGKCGQFSWIRRPGVFACQRTEAGGRELFPEIKKPTTYVFYPQNSSKLEIRKSEPITHKSVLPYNRSLGINSEPSSDDKLQITYHKAPSLKGNGGSENNRRLPIANQDIRTKISSGLSLSSVPESETEKLLNSARRLADQGFLPEALKVCEQFLSENTFHIQAHFLMGLICHALDDEERAEEYFNKAVYLDPNHYEALSHLAFIMEHRGDRNRAAQLRQRAQRILQRE